MNCKEVQKKKALTVNRENAEMMTADQIREKIQRGLDDADAGRVTD